MSSCLNLSRGVSVVSDGYQILGHSNPSNLPVSISPITKAFQILVNCQISKNYFNGGMHACALLLFFVPFTAVLSKLQSLRVLLPSILRPQCQRKSTLMSVLYLLFHPLLLLLHQRPVCDRA